MAFYADKDYTEDQAILEAMQSVMQGNLTLQWMDVYTEKVKGRPSDPRRGLTYQDLDLGSYGYSEIPEFVRNQQSMVARGSAKSGRLPDMGYLVNRKSDVWSDNVTALYEESKSRRWAPAVDVPWSELDAKPLAPELEAACAQLYTFLQECAAVAMDFPSRWVALINQEFIEQKSFLCAQMLDAARQLEGFRKRALYGGAGLKRAAAAAEQGLKEWLWVDSYPQGSLAINVALQGFLLTTYRQTAAFAPARTDRVLMGRVMQDAARHTSYGYGALRYHLAHQPAQKAALNAWLDGAEHVMLALLGSPELLEPMIIVCGGGLEAAQVRAGRIATVKYIRLVVHEYLERVESAGLAGRAATSRLPVIISSISVQKEV
ncbi:MAG: hypothetical protein ACREQN_03660 [Candidatus Binataceae bacterium]